MACKPLTKDSLSKESNKPGNYYFYGKKKGRKRELLYVGHSKVVKHRLQSYREVDDFSVHPTKASLRDEIECYTVKYRPRKRAMALERKIKKSRKPRHNYL